MKKPLFAVMVLGLVFAGASWLHAQDPAKVRVAFPFVVNGAVLPAGDYMVAPASDDLAVVTITSKDGKKIALSAVHDGQLVTDQKTTFEFKKYGDTYFLWKVNVAGEYAHEISLPANLVADTLARLAQQRYHTEPAAETGSQR